MDNSSTPKHTLNFHHHVFISSSQPFHFKLEQFVSINKSIDKVEIGIVVGDSKRKQPVLNTTKAPFLLLVLLCCMDVLFIFYSISALFLAIKKSKPPKVISCVYIGEKTFDKNNSSCCGKDFCYFEKDFFSHVNMMYKHECIDTNHLQNFTPQRNIDCNTNSERNFQKVAPQGSKAAKSAQGGMDDLKKKTHLADDKRPRTTNKCLRIVLKVIHHPLVIPFIILSTFFCLIFFITNYLTAILKTFLTHLILSWDTHDHINTIFHHVLSPLPSSFATHSYHTISCQEHLNDLLAFKITFFSSC